MSAPVLITGAFGQVGKRVTALLLSRGHTVVVTDLRTDSVRTTAEKLAEAPQPGTLRTTFADLLDRAAVEALVDEHRPDAIIHLAAMFSPQSYRNPQLARRINVGGTENLVRAGQKLPTAPLLLFASSAAVYGSRNPHRHPERITADTPVAPIDQYGEDKVLAESVITRSGLPHAFLRLGGVLSPDTTAGINTDHLVLIRATPGDNRLHGVDARDVALAFANAVGRRDSINGKVLLIAGNDTYAHTHRDVEDSMFEAMGIGRLGPSASLPGDPGDDRGWAFTGWCCVPDLVAAVPVRAPIPAADSPPDVMITLQPMNIVQAAADLFWSKPVKDYPDLKIALSEGGTGWIPYFLERLDRTYEMHFTWTAQDFGGRLPSEVFREHFLTCFISDPVGVRLRHDIGIDIIAWEADYPHSDSMWPGAPEQLGDVFTGVPDDEIDKMTHLNAMRWYSFDPFAHTPREQCTVAALRAAAVDHDVSVRSHSHTVLTAEEKLAAFHAQISAVAGAGR
ncbi:NAD-dependent epimerase/dehydratase family protein [Nocardia fusca]|uniref:NAD-dependent epimerase/dehydratase family protein n=1 Tax=Nocardia fusca TaxID=941183 RepID=UPI0037CBCA43